ncbi:hypothetical protein BDW02DRAFT_610598 [Decorospora gaudefroyi]|uniref:DUF7587 domain-containing protein n=1 Tax=Decorospora gaudefroyi TaxID=184978 RepID=A0A6A5K5K6_9PLEO|nr:hypothetical protein BDW02DRAFT_610598 [Decorospora gaudefroyi]
MPLPGFFPLPDSPDLKRVVQGRLIKIHQQFPASCPRTLDDFRIRRRTEDETYDAAAVFKQAGRALDWAEFLAVVQVDIVPTERTLLFRVQDQAVTDQVGVYASAARKIPFDDEYRQRNSVQEFVKSLVLHLGLKEIEAKTEERIKTMFTSTSPRLEWALHLTGKKSASRELGDQVDFVIFDLRALRKTPDTTVFRVTNVLQFLETSGQTNLIPRDYRQWARNCDEHIIMGKGVGKGIVHVVPWPELRGMSIINEPFFSAYTLSTYERFRDGPMGGRLETGYEEACRLVVNSAKA